MCQYLSCLNGVLIQLQLRSQLERVGSFRCYPVEGWVQSGGDRYLPSCLGERQRSDHLAGAVVILIF